MTTAQQRLQMHLVQALTRCENTAVQDHLEAALAYCKECTATALIECPHCGKSGFPERIRDHRCPSKTPGEYQVGSRDSIPGRDSEE